MLLNLNVMDNIGIIGIRKSYDKMQREMFKFSLEMGIPLPIEWTDDVWEKFFQWLSKRNNKDNSVMEKENSKQEKEIDIPEGWEVKRIDGTKIVIGEKEKKEEYRMPKTWDECIRIFEEFDRINVDSEVVRVGMKNPVISYGKKDYKLLPVGLGEPMLALSQLLICRNAWWKELGWKPYAGGEEVVYCIVNHSGYITKMAYDKSVIRILRFPTAEVRDKFLKTFKDLIEKAKDLL